MALRTCLLFVHGVASVDFIHHHAVHLGQRYERVSSESIEPTLLECNRKCAMTRFTPDESSEPCNAYNYRESDGSCQLITDGKNHLIEARGYMSYVQWLCLREHPTIPNATVSFEGWTGKYPAPQGGKVRFRCENPKGFSDGSRLQTATCGSESPDSWCTSFKGGPIQCEKLQHTYPECRLTEKGREYVGRENKTESGKECLAWFFQPYGVPNDFLGIYKDRFTNMDTWSHGNYCRNPSGRARPWCFVSDPSVQWEYCDIPMCTITDPPECKMTQQGGEYIGRQNVTHSGFPCLPWKLAEDENKDIGPSIPDSEEIDENYNFCRNSGRAIAPWCWIGDENGPKFEYCDIIFCDFRQFRPGTKENVYPECRLSQKGKEYVGTQNVTRTGKSCLFWDTQPYGTPWDFNFVKSYTQQFLNMESSLHKNYCRNPGMHRKKPWCFVSDPRIQWEYCNIPFCHDPNPPECKLTEKGGEYMGRKNVTISGSPCQHWLALLPRFFDRVFELFSAFSDEVDGSHNFCRSPTYSFQGPWCSTSSVDGPTWEYCDVPFCPKSDGEQCSIRVSGECITPKECKVDKKGLTYMGTNNVTISGYPCQPWSSRFPNNQNDMWFYDDMGSSFPDDLFPSHNFCRNPTEYPDGPWCWNGAGTNPRFDICYIPIC